MLLNVYWVWDGVCQNHLKNPASLVSLVDEPGSRGFWAPQPPVASYMFLVESMYLDYELVRTLGTWDMTRTKTSTTVPIFLPYFETPGMYECI